MNFLNDVIIDIIKRKHQAINVTQWDKSHSCEMYQKDPSTNHRIREFEYQGRNGWKALSKRKLYDRGVANKKGGAKGDLED